MRPITSVLAVVIASVSISVLVHCESSSSPATAPSPSPPLGDAATPTGDAAAADECVAPTGPGTKHGGDALTADTVWKASDGPHVVTFGFIIEAGATLTIEPCAKVMFDGASGGYGITVRGKLVAEGTPSKRITFDAVDPAKPWSGLTVDPSTAGMISLASAALSNGGNTDNANILGLLDIRGADGAPTERLRAKDVTLTGSQQYGVVLRNGGTFTSDSTNLVVSGAKLFPVRADARLTTNIPSGTYTGNTNDEILLDLAKESSNDTTLHDRGVPYRLGGVQGVNAGKVLAVGVSGPTAVVATLTIEAGVTIRASATSSIVMKKDSNQNAVGRLVVKGTVEKPVIFTSASATPVAGDWQGLVFDAPDAIDSIDHARVEYAGGPSQASSFHCDAMSTTGGFSTNEDAAIAIYGKPGSAFVTNTSIVSSAGDGVGRSWSGDLVDFLGTNTFDKVAACKQSYPRSTAGSCPTGAVPCP
ncbi:MAG: Fibronectin type domain protein [Myxococcaceae bacterium]|nr:Fibronectin type domain protein [Myxococcaceae bacterium]